MSSSESSSQPRPSFLNDNEGNVGIGSTAAQKNGQPFGTKLKLLRKIPRVSNPAPRSWTQQAEGVSSDFQRARRFAVGIVGQGETHSSDYLTVYTTFALSRRFDREPLLPILRLLTNQTSNATFCDQLVDFILVVNECLAQSEAQDFSMHTLVVEILEGPSVVLPPGGITDDIRQATLQAVFLSIGTLSMLFEPSTTIDPRVFTLEPSTHFSSMINRAQDISIATRPISKLTEGFGKMLPSLKDLLSTEERPEELIFASALNYYGLSRIGKININWSYTLSTHLDFEPRRRRLTLFRLPSFCALCCLVESRENVFSKIFDQGQTSYFDSKEFLQEVLFSYRLLFGQDGKSRALFRKTQRKRLQGNNNPIDDLLDKLCTESSSSWFFRNGIQALPTVFWPESCLGLKGTNENYLLEQSVYSTLSDFPVLGERLLKIQKFSYRQTPSRVRDLWRDRRNPLQWYTFWAVLWVGGITIMMSLVQIGLAAVQVYYQVNPPQ